MTAPMTPLSVGIVPEHFSIPFHRAQSSGAFAQANLDVRLEEMPRGTGSMTHALRVNELDVVVALTEGLVADLSTDISAGNSHALQNGETTLPYKLLGFFTLSPLAWGIAVRNSSETDDVIIQSVADLENRTFGVSRLGSGSHLMTMLLARRENWRSKPRFKAVGGLSDLLESLRTGETAAFLWETVMLSPFEDQTTPSPNTNCDKGSDSGGSIRQVGKIVSPWPCFCVAAREEVLADPTRRDAVFRLIECVRRSAADFVARRDTALQEVQDRCHVSLEAATCWLDSVKFAEGRVDDQEREVLARTLQECARILDDVGITEGQAITAPMLYRP